MKIWCPPENDQALTFTEIGETEKEYPPEILVFEIDDLYRFKEASHLAKDSQNNAAYSKVYNALTSRPQNRQLMTMRTTFRAGLDRLAQKIPNFTEVIDYIRCCAEIAWRTDKVLRFTPILLCGEGGVDLLPNLVRP